MAESSLEIVYRGGVDTDTAPPFRLPVEGVSSTILAEALRPLHFTARDDRTCSTIQPPVPIPSDEFPPLRCEMTADPEPGPWPAGTAAGVQPRFTAHQAGDLLKLPGGSLRLRSSAGDTIACPLATPAQRRGTFPLLLEMAVIHALALRGIPVFHGASFTIKGRSILALGPSCSGKTTLAAAAIRAGGKVISDDSVLVLPRRSSELSVRPFRRDIQIRRGSRRLFPRALSSHIEPMIGAAEARWTLRREAAASCFTDDVSLDLIWVLTLDRRLRHCRIGSLPQAEALAALIQGSSPLYLSGRYPRERAALLPPLRSLVERAPACQVRLGKALLEDPAGELERLVAFV